MIFLNEMIYNHVLDNNKKGEQSIKCEYMLFKELIQDRVCHWI